MREMVEVEVSSLFQIGDKVVHPMHGAGIVESIVQKKVNGVMRDYYVLKLPVRAMVVMIPTENSEEIGVRPIVDREQADRVLEEIGSLQVEMTQNWNRRYRAAEKRRPVPGGLCGQGADAPGRGPGPVHRRAEDAPLRQADPDLGDRHVPKQQL